MSGFIGASGTDTSFLSQARSEERLLSIEWRPEHDFLDNEVDPSGQSWITPWWPRSTIGFDGGDASVGLCLDRAASYRPHDAVTTGAEARVLFQGYTRDQYGSPAGGCNVKLFLTATDTLIDSVVSDAGGYFLLSSYYSPDTHYIVVHRGGSPDIDGISPNTLVGT